MYRSIYPFHFLERCGDFSKEKPTKSPCSKFYRPPKRTAVRDIRNFLTTFPSLQSRSYQRNLGQNSNEDKYRQHKNDLMTTKEDKIRDQHDRGKKRKYSWNK